MHLKSEHQKILEGEKEHPKPPKSMLGLRPPSAQVIAET